MEEFLDEFEDEDSEDIKNYEPDYDDEKITFPTAKSRALEEHGVSLYYP
jgi:hypothetical protein